MLLEGGKPGDRRGFLHKSFIGRAIGGVAKGFVTGGPLGAIRGGVTGVLGGTARPTQFSEGEKRLGRELKFGETSAPRTRSVEGLLPCFPGFRRDPRTGKCALFIGEQRGVDDTPVGEAVMGQYGAGLVPGNRVIDRAVCLKGMQLGNDGVCYNKSQISNKQRMWPAGRRPLLTGGDMRAISIAARAGRRLEGATERLQRLGLMKKPAAPRRLAPHKHAKLLPAVSIN